MSFWPRAILQERCALPPRRLSIAPAASALQAEVRPRRGKPLMYVTACDARESHPSANLGGLDAKIKPGCFERIGHTIDRVQLIGELMKLDHRFANPPDGTGVHEVTNHRVLRTLDVQLEEIDSGGNHIGEPDRLHRFARLASPRAIEAGDEAG